jgi:hypothetical protein
MAALPEKTMEVCSCHGREGPSHSRCLEAALDKLVAVRMDLEPVCGSSGAGAHGIVSSELIASTCEILLSAITDIQNVIRGIDDLGDSPTPQPV